MERANIRVEGFRWDARNTAKIAAHNLTAREVQAVFRNRPRFFVNLPRRSADYVMVGPDAEGRFIFAAIAPTDEDGLWYVVTAYRLARRRALRIYERGG